MTSHRHLAHRRLLAGTAAVLGSLALAACGADDDDTSTVEAAAPTTVAPGTTDHADHQVPVVAVGAIDYSFQDLPASIPAGTPLTLTNTSTDELHEIVAFRLPDAETRSVEELMALPAEELEPAIAAGPPALVVLAPPGQEGFVAVGDGTLREPGRYVVLCGIPIGADPQAYLDAAATSEGPPDVPGGPPHFTAGMYAEVFVEAA